MNNDLLYRIALTLIPHIGDARAKILIEKFGTAESVFKVSKKHLENIEGFGTVVAKAIRQFSDFKICEEEILFIEKNKVQPLFVSDGHYPRRLLNCCDSPALLYYKGNADLNAPKLYLS